MEINSLHFDHLVSTNTWSKENFQQFDKKKLTLVTANSQSGGRGQFKKKWISPSGLNIYASFTFFTHNTSILGNIPQVLALSAVETLQFYSLKSLLKWPNDILMNGKKIGGILCETIQNDRDLVVVTGIGLNVNMPKNLLDQIDQPATSMLVESNKKYDINKVLSILTGHFQQNLEILLSQGFTPFLETYTQNLIHNKGDRLHFPEASGTFQRIDNDGSLIILLDNGKEQKCLRGFTS